MSYKDQVAFESMLGKIFTKVEHLTHNAPGDSDAIVFTVSDDEAYAQLYHADCCASVIVEDICGDLNDLVDSPIVRAEQNGNEDHAPERSDTKDRFYDDSETWTFFRIGTTKGTVVIRWYGSSNGYYSETPDFERII